MTTHREILNLFGEQHGVASVRQLDRLGLGRSDRYRWKQRGLWSIVAPGIVQLTGVPDSFTSRAMTALLAGGPDACLCGFTAGSLYGVRMMPRRRIHLLVGQEARPVLPAWAEPHRTCWLDGERDRLERGDRLVVTSPLRTLFSLAACCGIEQLSRAAEDMWRTGLITPDDAAGYLSRVRRQGRTGVTVLAEWLERVSERGRPTGSGAEFDLLPHLRLVGLPEPKLQHEVELLTGVTVHLDIAYPEVRLDVEPGHSAFHTGDAVRRDYQRDIELGRLGWQVMRFDEVQQRSPRWCATQVRDTYWVRHQILR